MQTRNELSSARRWVIKIGSALLTDDGKGLDQPCMDAWVRQMAALRAAGKEIIIVSSGAVAAGMTLLGWNQRPHELHKLQAAAAVGQMRLVQAWESRFKAHGLHTAQVLLTHDDLRDRQRYLNARTALETLIDLGVIPIVNENDTVAFEELRLGDNDTLAAQVGNAVVADVLVLLTDQDGLFTKDPRKHADAKLISEAKAGDPAIAAVAGPGGALGRGGMETKVRAARLAARSGTSTVIAAGRGDEVITRIHAGEVQGTFLTPDEEPIAARKRWLAGQLTVVGRLRLNAGAVQALRENGGSLLSVGVTEVEGEFQRGDLVCCQGPDGGEIARGLVNYASGDARRIQGVPSDRIEETLGYINEPELIHRDNLTLL